MNSNDLFHQVSLSGDVRPPGGHFDASDNVTAQDVDVMVDFCNALFEYLYVAPTKLQRLKQRLPAKVQAQ